MFFTSEDACLLLHKLEEICTRTSQGNGSDYITVWGKILKNEDEKWLLQKLQVVRFVLARYFARCGVIGVGGRWGTVGAGHNSVIY